MIEFFCPGLPCPGGSKKGFVNPKTNRVVIVDDAGKRNKDWRTSVQVFCRQAYDGAPLTGPLHLDITFVMPRPQGHFGMRKGVKYLKDDAPKYVTKKPDVLKLARSTEDALTSIAYQDDAQIAVETLARVYGEIPGAQIRITQLPLDGKATIQ